MHSPATFIHTDLSAAAADAFVARVAWSSLQRSRAPTLTRTRTRSTHTLALARLI